MYDASFSIILFGDTSTGRTTFTQKFLPNLFESDQTMTIGVDFGVKSLSVDGQKVKLQIKDFGGEERFRFLLSTYVRGTQGGLLLFDVTNYSTIAHIDDWLSVIRKEMRAEDKFPILVVGIVPGEGIEREVSGEEGKKIAKSRNVNGYIECNLKTGKNVEKAFEALTRLILADSDYHPPLKEDEELTKSSKKKVKKQKRVDSFDFFGFESKNIMTPPKTPSKPPLHPPPPKPPEAPAMAPKGREPYFTETMKYLEKKDNEEFRERRRNLANRLEKYIGMNLRIVAASLVQGRDTILYSTDNWDISADVSRVISSWDSLTAQFIMISGVKYSVLQCTSERLVATSIRGEGHILGLKDGEYKLLLYLEPDGKPIGEVYPYIFTHPRPPDDFEPAPQSQIRAPLKVIDPEDEVNCQYCGKLLAKDEQMTHSCKNKPKNK